MLKKCVFLMPTLCTLTAFELRFTAHRGDSVTNFVFCTKFQGDRYAYTRKLIFFFENQINTRIWQFMKC